MTNIEWHRVDGARVIPKSWSSADDPGRLARNLTAALDPEWWFAPGPEWHLGRSADDE